MVRYLTSYLTGGASNETIKNNRESFISVQIYYPEFSYIKIVQQGKVRKKLSKEYLI